jgi:hypothetical protein
MIEPVKSKEEKGKRKKNDEIRGSQGEKCFDVMFEQYYAPPNKA